MEASSPWNCFTYVSPPIYIPLDHAYHLYCRHQKSTVPERLFLASRILFLCTASSASSSQFIRTLVERKSGKHSTVDIIGSKLDLLRTSILASERFAREAMTDLLKFTFNLLLHYPKVSPVDSSKHKGLTNTTVFQITQEILVADLEIQSDPNQASPVMGDYWSDRLDG